ncbi:MAG: hypothetical protein V8T45_01905 [Oscillospiraceae bacterium]
MNKKATALLLCLVMMLSLFVPGTLATDATQITPVPAETAAVIQTPAPTEAVNAPCGPG